MNWEQKLQEAMMDQQSTIESRRIHGRPAADSTATARARNWWLLPALGLCAIVLFAGVMIATLQGDDGGIGVTTATDNGPSGTVDADTTDDVAPTSLATNPTALPQVVVSVTPTPVSTATPVPTATLEPTSPAPSANDLCRSDRTFQLVNVVNVELDDPDGGLVLHEGPGVSSPETGVLPPWGNGVATGNCEMVGQSTWIELRVATEPSWEEDLAWVNGAYLEAGPDLSDLPDVQPATISLGRDGITDNFEYTERVVRWVSVSLASSEWLSVVLDLLAAGPTDAERRAGFSSELTRAPSTDGCNGQPVQYIFANPDYIRVCIISAGIGTDARVASQIGATMAGVTSEMFVLLDPQGDCFGDLSGENRCLQSPTLGSEPHTAFFSPATNSVNDHVRDLRVTTADGCSVVTIEMGEGWSENQVSSPSAEVRGGISVAGGRGEVLVTFGDWFDLDSFFEPQSLFWTENGFAASALLVSGREGEPHHVRIANHSSGSGRVQVLTNPARIEVTLPCADGTFPEHVTENFVLDELLPTSDGVTVSGFGVAFEAVANAVILTADGALVESAQFENFGYVTDGFDRTSTAGLRLRTGSTSVAWGRLDFVVSGLAPGDYILNLNNCDQCGDDPAANSTFAFTVE